MPPAPHLGAPTTPAPEITPGAHRRRRPHRRVALAVAVLASVAVIVAIALGRGAAVREHGPGDTMVAASTEPLALDTIDAEVADRYRAAADHRAVFEAVTCWCGCEQFLAHRNLHDCFVRADGRGWEAHAAGCGVCLAEAAQVSAALEAGQPAAAIASAIDGSFGPTVTTLPP